MTERELTSFLMKLHSLCESYQVLVRREGRRRDRPSKKALTFYEIELSAKVESAEVEGDLLEHLVVL